MHWLFHEWFHVHGWFLVMFIVWPQVLYYTGIHVGRSQRG